jgi:hypothetical protein
MRAYGAMRGIQSFLLGSLSLLGAGMASTSASAFCRTTACEGCVQPIGACVTQGQPVYWAADCVSYDVQQAASKQVPLAVANEAVDRAFYHWTHVVCPETNSAPSISTLNRGPVVCDRVEYNDPNARIKPDGGPNQQRVGGNANIIMFRDSTWTETKPSDPTTAIALTTVTFVVATGELLDADIEINATLPLSSSDTTPPDRYDLESVLTHEVGHFLGLAHSDRACEGSDCPTMTASYARGLMTYRTLETDDVNGICSVYPTGRGAAQTACSPVLGFASECGIPKSADSGCALARAGSDRVCFGLSGTCCSTVAVLCLRRRRRRAAEAESTSTPAGLRRGFRTAVVNDR